MSTPRLFIIRHGETEWSLNGRHTGTSDIPLTANGEKRIIATGQALVGDEKLIVPKNLAHIYVSPRRRAQHTLDLLNLGCPLPFTSTSSPSTPSPHTTTAKITIDPRVAEWNYGAYEGLTSSTIASQRREAGQSVWDIWRDGCPDGESPAQIEERVDGLIAEIREMYHRSALEEGKKGDVLIVAHGHILRALAARWVGWGLGQNPGLILEAGGVGTLSYEHHNIKEPAIVLGGAFMADLAAKVQGN